MWGDDPSSARWRESRLGPYVGAMDLLTAFGFVAVTAMLICYGFEARSHWWTLGFAVSCLLGAAYGFLQGAWPIATLEVVWAVVAIRKWLRRSRI
jgi:hypothetical protein